ncbi:hypothetical protein T265_01987 [Opisthorchis viverrini]|uniref:Uncharacterized protein n=1 Tax=Opisthorchis viverrini TaxID=6198 RepID=A0A075AIM7_OPIVI|nr:hypothetical protein T265_01987 [Opisthorchis viverrini]KER31904.1 hypothetical protein T265_01987 [Opisthorchis viverrini]
MPFSAMLACLTSLASLGLKNLRMQRVGKFQCGPGYEYFENLMAFVLFEPVRTDTDPPDDITIAVSMMLNTQ